MLMGRSRNDVVLPVEMSRLLDMGLYNPRDFRDTLPHILSYTFHYAASLSMSQLQLFDGLIDHITKLQNDVSYNVRVLKDKSEGHLKATREAVSSPLF
jgi:hypothetical protein